LDRIVALERLRKSGFEEKPVPSAAKAGLLSTFTYGLNRYGKAMLCTYCTC
jgi:hypothetical protein